MKGIILAGGRGKELYPMTEGVSKHLLDVYDKPMIYYALSNLMLAGIKDILIITTKEDQYSFMRLLKDGKDFGVKISYIVQANPNGIAEAFTLGEEFIGDDPVCLTLADNIFYGTGFTKILKEGVLNANNGYATILVNQVKNPERFGILEIDNNKIKSIEEKPKKPKSNYAITGLYFYPKGACLEAKKLKYSKRKQLEITDLHNMYLKNNKLKYEILSDDFVWFDTGSPESKLNASNMIEAIEKNKGKIICCPEQIAYFHGWITKEDIKARKEELESTNYGKYLLNLVK